MFALLCYITRSRSYSPRPSQTKRRSRSRSRSPKDRRRSRSRSPARKRSPPPQRRQRSPKHYSPPRKVSRSPQRKRSPSPVERNYPVKRQADSSGKRQGYRSKSPSPAPVKRSKDDRYYPDDSPEEKRYASSHRQKSPSPRRESPSQYGGKMYADQPSTSKRPLFPAGKKPDEIESVKIVDKAKKQKLDKRFQTLEQLAQGHFDFEENITIGIHRGPSHMELDNDIPVNYEFNSKTFLMIFPKKDYVKAIFDRDEIKAFHHDDILDEEAYTEKRTITVKPTDKPKPSRYPEQTDYKITIGGDREGYGDKRMVQDAGSRTRMSRPGYPEADVKVRLDPRPDPRYEKLYREQQRQEDQSLMQEKIHRNPNDLRYNLMKRNTSGDRGDRERERGRDMGMVDARSKIEARRQESHSDDRRDRPRDSRGSRDSPPPSRSFGGEKKNPVKTDLPDFKNRPEDVEIPPDAALGRGRSLQTERSTNRWGYCEICDVPINSEKQAMEHVYGASHRENEKKARIPSTDESGPPSKIRRVDDDGRGSQQGGDARGLQQDEGGAKGSQQERGSSRLVGGNSRGSQQERGGADEALSSKYGRMRADEEPQDSRRIRGNNGGRMRADEEPQDSGRIRGNNGGRRYSDDADDYPRAEEFDGEPRDRNFASSNKIDKSGRGSRKKYVWIIGTGEIKQCLAFALKQSNFGIDLGLGCHDIFLVWLVKRGMKMVDVHDIVKRKLLDDRNSPPDYIILHVGGNDLETSSLDNFLIVAKRMINSIRKLVPKANLVWSQMIPRWTGRRSSYTLNKNRNQLEDEMALFVLELGGCYIRYPMIDIKDKTLYHKSVDDDLYLDFVALEKILIVLKGGIISITQRNITIIPNLKGLSKQVSGFVGENLRSGTNFLPIQKRH